jgi:probable HAF family extracellular repeat protein
LSGDTETHGFFWENGQLTDIGTLGGTVISPSAMNEKGVIVGQSTVASGEFHAFFWRRGLMTDLGPLPGFGDTTCIGAFGINSHDQVVGQAEFNLCDPTHAQAAHAFLWENGSMIDLNTFVPKGTDIKLNEVEQINDSGEMFGIGTLPDGNNRAFLLIPCDDDHPDVEGCDYDMVDESDMPATQMATTAKPVLSPDAIRQLMQSAGRHSKLWYRGFGAQTQPK